MPPCADAIVIWLPQDGQGSWGVRGGCAPSSKRTYLLLQLPMRHCQLVALVAVREPISGMGTSLARQSKPVNQLQIDGTRSSRMGATSYHCARASLRESQPCRGTLLNSIRVGKLAKKRIAGSSQSPQAFLQPLRLAGVNMTLSEKRGLC